MWRHLLRVRVCIPGFAYRLNPFDDLRTKGLELHDFFLLFRDDLIKLEEQVLLVGELGLDIDEAIFRHVSLRFSRR